MKLRFTFYALLLCFSIFAQTSDKGYSFQGFAIDPDGKALGATSITVQFIVSPAGGGTGYTETHVLTTDAFGVFHAVIGDGTPESGSVAFETMDYTKKGTVYKLKVSVKKTSGGTYTTISEANFNAVPYARKAENGVPVGTIVAYAGPMSKIPEGWAVCNGAQVDGSASQWKQLYDVIGNSWGGSGTNFNLPDLRGMFLRGVNDARADGYRDPDAAGRVASKTGGNTGDAVGSIQADNFETHGHSGSGNTNNDGAHSHTDNEYATADNDDNDGVGQYIGGRGGNYNNDGGTGFIRPGGSDHSHAFSFNTNNTGGNETRPTNAGVYYIIKY